MKKLHAMFLSLMAIVTFGARAGIVMETDLPVDSEITFWLNTTSATQPVSVDFGDGEPQYFTIDPNQYLSNRSITGTVKGKQIVLEGNITELDAQNLKLTSVTIEGMSKLEKLNLAHNIISEFAFVDDAPTKVVNLSDNKLENGTSWNNNLTLNHVGATLTDLNISGNEGLVALHMGTLSQLQYLTANDCPSLTTVFICAPEDSHDNLKSIYLNNCDIAHFYPVSLPQLTTLELSNNSLVSGPYDSDPFVLGDYPKLTTLDLSYNKGIGDLDVTECPLLEKLHVSGCSLSSLDLSQCPELHTLSASDNKISSLDLGNNKQLGYLYVANNPISDLDFTKMLKIEGVDISGTKISRVDLYYCYFLKSFVARNTQLEFVDFNAQQPERMTMIDLRDCPNFTPMSMAYTVKTVPVARTTMSTAISLYLSGSHPEIADTDYATSPDMHWVCDSKGDGSADYPVVDLTVADAEATGEYLQGSIERLYPYGGLGLDYDLEIYKTEGGKFLLVQWEPEWFQTITSLSKNLRRGIPVCVYPIPDAGKQFKSVTVNGREIASQWFVVDEAATIKVNYEDRENFVSFKVNSGQSLSFTVATATANGTVDIDWGTGSRTPYTGIAAYRIENYDAPGTRIDGKAAGSTVTVYGDVAGLDLSCYGDVGEELFGLPNNRVQAVDVTNAPGLKLLNLYWNPVKELDLSACEELEVLDFSYTAVTDVDLSANKNLVMLSGYANSDEIGDNFAQLNAIDLRGLSALRTLDLHNQGLANVDVTEAPQLTSLNVTNNKLSSLDLRGNKQLVVLRAAGNELTTLDVTNCPALVEMNLDANKLTALDVSHNTKLEELSLANNYIKDLDTHELAELGKLYINGNGISADELNDIYYKLPMRKHRPSDDESMAVRYNLFVNQGADREANEGDGADGSIAVARQWIPNPNGTNSMAASSYLDIAPSAYGTVTITDASGKEYAHGSKVPKYAKMTITAVPAPGNEFKGFTLNGEELIEETGFIMPGIYTVFAPVFTGDAGVEDATRSSVSVGTDGAGNIVIRANAASATVFATDGRMVAETALTDGCAIVTVPGPGTYFVRMICDGSKVVKAVFVK